ncbi:hypothetical protein [Clostridium baratii]|uniref:hypothetical protein n=1 Tax=Clostridium baratii TaxID=1561 RepID=UPI0030CB07EA
MSKTERKEKYVLEVKVDKEQTKEICEIISRLDSEILKLKDSLKELPIEVDCKILDK